MHDTPDVLNFSRARSSFRRLGAFGALFPRVLLWAEPGKYTVLGGANTQRVHPRENQGRVRG